MNDNLKDEIQKEEKDFKDNFIIALAHKLRTPLNGARWSIDSVLKNVSGEDQEILRGGYNKIIESINIVSEILKSIEPDSKTGFDGKKEKVNLCLVIDDILENLKFLITEREVEINYDRCDSATIYGDRKILDLGLANIFDNAFRYSPKGKISISLTKEGQIATLIVKDNGIGISEDDKKHLFEKFYRGKNALELDPDESGVGLYTTKRVIEMHKGEISVNSTINKGTEVKVTFPLD